MKMEDAVASKSTPSGDEDLSSWIEEQKRIQQKKNSKVFSKKKKTVLQTSTNLNHHQDPSTGRRSSILNLPPLISSSPKTLLRTSANRTQAPFKTQSPCNQTTSKQPTTTTDNDDLSFLDSYMDDIQNFDFNWEDEDDDGTDGNPKKEEPLKSRRELSGPLLLPIPSLRQDLPTVLTNNNSSAVRTPSPRFLDDDYSSPTYVPPPRRRDSTVLLPIPSLRQELVEENESSSSVKKCQPFGETAKHSPTLPAVMEGNELDTSIISQENNISMVVELEDADADVPFEKKKRRESSVLLPVPSLRNDLDNHLEEREQSDSANNTIIHSPLLYCSNVPSTQHDEEEEVSSGLSKSELNSSGLLSPCPDRPLDQIMVLPKVEGKSILYQIQEHVPTTSTEHAMLQLQQLTIEKEKLANQLHRLRRAYEDRITPFRDVFEEVRTCVVWHGTNCNEQVDFHRAPVSGFIETVLTVTFVIFSYSFEGRNKTKSFSARKS